MQHVSILLLSHANLAGLENARQGFLECNRYLEQQGSKPQFDVQLVAASPKVVLGSGIYNVKPDRFIDDIAGTDLIIIPPVEACFPEAIIENASFVPFIKHHHDEGAIVASLCLGAFVLAGTGLLNGRSCVTHWRAQETFSQLFPGVNLITENILTDENRICTGGGAFSSANLIVYLIEKLAGREAAMYCSKVFQVDMGRSSQAPFAIFTGQKEHDFEDVKKAQVFIESHYNEKLNVEKLCRRCRTGRRTFERRFKKATGNTVLEYIQRVRVEAAKRELEKGVKTINEVMYCVGYSDTRSFRQVFRKYAGLSPAVYRERFAGLAQVA